MMKSRPGRGGFFRCDTGLYAGLSIFTLIINEDYGTGYFSDRLVR